MPWVKVPPENHPLFHAALPDDPRVETMKMFGGVAAKVNGHIFAGLFARSTMVLLDDADRSAALALEGAAPFDPMGDGRARSEKVMLPERMMSDAASLRGWIARAFKAASKLPPKGARPVKAAKPPSAKATRAKPPPRALEAAQSKKAAKKPSTGAAAKRRRQRRAG